MSQQVSQPRTGLLASLLANNSTLRPSSSLYSKSPMKNQLGKNRSYSTNNLYKSGIGKSSDNSDNNHRYLPLCRALHTLGVKIKKLNYYMFCKLEQYTKSKKKIQQLDLQISKSDLVEFNSTPNHQSLKDIYISPSPIKYAQKDYITPIMHKNQLDDISNNKISPSLAMKKDSMPVFFENSIQEGNNKQKNNYITQQLKRGIQLLRQTFQLAYLKNCSNTNLQKSFNALKKHYNLKCSLNIIDKIYNALLKRVKMQALKSISNAQNQTLKIQLFVDFLQCKLMAIQGYAFNNLKFIKAVPLQKNNNEQVAFYQNKQLRQWQKQNHLSQIQQQIEATDTLSDIPVKDQSTSQDLIFDNYSKTKSFPKYQTEDQIEYNQKITLKKKNQEKIGNYLKKKKSIQEEKHNKNQKTFPLVKIKNNISKLTAESQSLKSYKVAKKLYMPIKNEFDKEKNNDEEMMIKLKHLVSENLDSYKHAQDFDSFSSLWYKELEQSLSQLNAVKMQSQKSQDAAKNILYPRKDNILAQSDSKLINFHENQGKASCVYQEQISFSDNMQVDSHNNSQIQENSNKYGGSYQQQKNSDIKYDGNPVYKKSQYYQSFNESMSLSKLQSFRFNKSKGIENEYSPISKKKFCQSKIIQQNNRSFQHNTLSHSKNSEKKQYRGYLGQSRDTKNSILLKDNSKTIKQTSGSQKITPNKFKQQKNNLQTQNSNISKDSWKKIYKRYDTLSSQISKIPSMSSFQKLSQMMEDLEKIRARGEKMNQLQTIFGSQEFDNYNSQIMNSSKKQKKSKQLTGNSIQKQQYQQTMKKDQKNARESNSNKSRSIKKYFNNNYSSKQINSQSIYNHSQTINRNRNYIQWSTPNQQQHKEKAMFSNELSNSVSKTCKKSKNTQKNSYQKQNKKQIIRPQQNKNQHEPTMSLQQVQKNKTLTTARKMQQQIDNIIYSRSKVGKTNNNTFNHLVKTKTIATKESTNKFF